jgi:hypothetical protein
MSLEPERVGALVDLVDRILVKGIILQADLIISVGGVPLIGVNLKAAIAGMTTMVDYGVMEAWDEKIRKSVLAESEEEAPLVENEQVIVKTVGSHYYQSESLPGTWRTGFLYLTDRRLFLFRKKPRKILFEVAIDRIKSVTVEGANDLKDKKEIKLLLLENNQADNGAVLIRADEVNALKSKIEEQITRSRPMEVLSSVH